MIHTRHKQQELRVTVGARIAMPLQDQHKRIDAARRTVHSNHSMLLPVHMKRWVVGQVESTYGP
jgi:hypothetical protein